MALATFALTAALVEDLITSIVAAILGEPDFSDLHDGDLGGGAALPGLHRGGDPGEPLS